MMLTSAAWKGHIGSSKPGSTQTNTHQGPRYDAQVSRHRHDARTWCRDGRHLKRPASIQEEKTFSADASSLVNKAYSTLKSPLQRASYLVGCRMHVLEACCQTPIAMDDHLVLQRQPPLAQLRLKGLQADEEGETIHDPGFLMEMMEAREAVDEAADAEALAQLLEDFRQKQQACMQARTRPVCLVSGMEHCAETSLGGFAGDARLARAGAVSSVRAG